MAAGRRRAVARQTGHTGTPHGEASAPYNWGAKIRAIADELDAEEATERRMADLRRIRSPSALIMAMRRDWPEQSRAVRKYAEAEGLALGEAWAKIIAAGVATIRKRRR